MLDELDKLRELRQSISRAREACAGSNVKDKNEFVYLLNDSLITAERYNYIGLLIDLGSVFYEALKISDYGDRLPLDDKLCDILNDLDKRIRELELTCL